jgi:nitrite reductase/ring-hydroxylating ferredoxin subunit
MVELLPRYVICRAEDIQPGETRQVTVGGREIAIFNINGEYYGLSNSCPHQGGPLCTGPVVGYLASARPGEYEFDENRRLIKCPWHGWEFDIATGQSWYDPRKRRVRPYPVTVQAGPVNGDDLVPGPYVAETLPVSVEDRLVVVEIGR